MWSFTPGKFLINVDNKTEMGFKRQANKGIKLLDSVNNELK